MEIDKRIKNNFTYEARREIPNSDNNNDDSDKRSSRSSKKFESVLYCSHCHKMISYHKFLQLEEGTPDIDEILSKMDFVYLSYEDVIVKLSENKKIKGMYYRILSKLTEEEKNILDNIKFKKRTKNEILLQCPKCNEIIKKKDILFLTASKSWQKDNTFLYRYKINKKDNKIILSAYLYSVYPVVTHEKLKYLDLNVRFVFNLDDNNVYSFQVYDVKKNKPIFKDEKRILNITYLSNSDNYLTSIHKQVLNNKYVQKSLMKYFNEMYNKKETFDDYKDIILFFRYHELNKETRDIIKKITDVSYIKANTAQKRKVILQDIYKMQSNTDYLMKIMKQKKCPMKKRFIKMAAENPFCIYIYKLLKNLGFKDYNVMLNIIEQCDKIDLMALFLDILPTKEDSSDIKILIKNMVKYKGEIYTKKNIFDCWDYYLLKDTGRMFNMVLTQIEENDDVLDNNIYDDNYIDIKEYFYNLQKMHDNLSMILPKLKNKNKKIPYRKEDLSLNCSIDDYEFLLAPNTHSLIDCGEKMGICVGGYGNSAFSKSCIIVFMMKNSKYIGCIELSSDKKLLIQAKAKYNNMLQEEKAIALKKWVEKNNIDASLCRDYKHIKDNKISFGDDLYPEGYNYAQVKYENLDEINKNIQIKTNYYIVE